MHYSRCGAKVQVALDGDKPEFPATVKIYAERGRRLLGFFHAGILRRANPLAHPQMTLLQKFANHEGHEGTQRKSLHLF
jgi:hypothetical protein